MVSSTAASTTSLPSLELVEGNDYYDNYVNSIRSPITRNNYVFAMKKYMQYQNVSKLEDLLLLKNVNANNANLLNNNNNNVKLIESNIISYIVHLKNVEKIGYGTIKAYLAAIMLFYAVNDISNLNRKKISRYLPDPQKISEDRGYTTEEIAQMLQGSDIRVRALILLLASTGIRIGAIANKEKPLLQLKHLHFISKYKLYKIIIYQGAKEEYFCFTTPEAANAIQSYLQYRERYGEKLTPDSFLFREQFNTSDQFDCKNPKNMHLKGLSKLIAETAIRSGVTEKITLLEGDKLGQNRNKIFRTHGFRKTVTTKMIEAGLSDFVIDKLLGHKSKGGVTSKHYYRPDEDALLSEYIKSVNFLTINDENRLRLQVEQLTIKRSEFDEMRQMLESQQSELYRLSSQYDHKIE